MNDARELGMSFKNKFRRSTQHECVLHLTSEALKLWCLPVTFHTHEREDRLKLGAWNKMFGTLWLQESMVLMDYFQGPYHQRRLLSYQSREFDQTTKLDKTIKYDTIIKVAHLAWQALELYHIHK